MLLAAAAIVTGSFLKCPPPTTAVLFAFVGLHTATGVFHRRLCCTRHICQGHYRTKTQLVARVLHVPLYVKAQP